MASQTIEQRITGVRILLASFFDYLPDPPTSTGLISRSALPGPAPGKRVPCAYCRRSGRVRLRRGSRICPACEGLGWRLRRVLNPSHPDYEQPWDEYIEEPVEDAQDQHPSAMTRHQLEAALERLAHDEEERQGIDSGDRFGWERERRLYERQGSYAQLALALYHLQEQWPVGHDAIRRQYLRGLGQTTGTTSLLLIEVAEEWLAREMRGEIRVPIWLVEQSSDQKRETVADLATQGLTPGQIGKRLRIPKLKVQRMLRSFTLPADALTGASGKART